MSNTTLIPSFINNSPAGEDLFEGKSQERVANYISNNLVSNDKCRIVGIDGGWGTGKSNLIEITKKKLNEVSTDKYHFFVYDAWGHQEDLQRRSFLEELTSFLTGKGNGRIIISDVEEWNKKLKALLAKSREVETKTIPSLSTGVVLSGLVLILTPLFKTIADLLTYTWLQVLITSLPLLLLIAIFCFYYWKRTNNKAICKERINQATKKLFHIYQKSQKSDTTFETISEDEPSVKKFRDWMRAIACDLGSNRLIIVFDNMDRLPDHKITELWSSIHTFFAEENYDGIKVIIPFDRQNIKDAFKHNDHQDGHSYTDDFINKTFDIVYRVSPPILSDWKNFFENKWKQAFGIIDDEFEKVIQIFDHLANCKTPRDMVVFINECVAAKQINPDIPLRYIALFVINKNILVKHPEEQIINPSYLGSLNFLYDSDDNLPKFMAAAIYQIDHNRALEVVFTDRLTTALNNYNKEQINLISESAAFPVILAKAVMKVENLKNAVLSLNDLGDKVVVKIWDDLYRKLNVQLSRLAEAKLEKYQLILLQKLTDKNEYLKKIAMLLNDPVKFLSVDYYKSIKDIENVIGELGLILNIEDYLVDKEVPAEDFTLLLKTTPDQNTYKIYCDNVELNNYIEGLDSIREWEDSGYLTRIPVSYTMTKLTEMLISNISEKASDINELAAYYTAYKNVSRGLVNVIPPNVIIQEHFTDYEEPYDVFYYDLICMRLARWDNFEADYAADFVAVLEKEDDETVNSITKTLLRFVNYGDLLLKLPLLPCPLLKAVIKKLTIDPGVTLRADIVGLMKKIDLILNTTEIKPQILLSRLAAWDSEKITKENIVNILPNIQFFTFCDIYSNKLTTHCVKLALDYYDNLSYEKWFSELQLPQSTIIPTSLVVLKKQFPSNANAAIKDVLKQISQGEISIPDRNLWEKIIEKTNRNTLKAALNGVQEFYLTSKEISPDEFLFFADWLFTYTKLEYSNLTLRRLFQKSILQPQQVQIILKHSEEMKNLYAISEDKDDFNNDILVMLSQGKAHVQPLANLLYIKSPEEDAIVDDKNEVS